MFEHLTKQLKQLEEAARLAQSKLKLLDWADYDVTVTLGTTGTHVSLVLDGNDPARVWAAFLTASDQKYQTWIRDGRLDALHRDGNLLISCSLEPVPLWIEEWLPDSVVLPRAVKIDEEVDT